MIKITQKKEIPFVTCKPSDQGRVFNNFFEDSSVKFNTIRALEECVQQGYGPMNVPMFLRNRIYNGDGRYWAHDAFWPLFVTSSSRIRCTDKQGKIIEIVSHVPTQVMDLEYYKWAIKEKRLNETGGLTVECEEVQRLLSLEDNKNVFVLYPHNLLEKGCHYILPENTISARAFLGLSDEEIETYRKRISERSRFRNNYNSRLDVLANFDNNFNFLPHGIHNEGGYPLYCDEVGLVSKSFNKPYSSSLEIIIGIPKKDISSL